MTPGVDREVVVAVCDVQVRYATGIDRRDWAAFRSCFTEDCDADYGEIGSWHGAGEITTWMRDMHEPLGHTLHRITNQVVEAHDAGVSARCYVDVLVFGPDGATCFHSAGYYDDVLERTDNGWRIARRRFTTVLAPRVLEGSPL